MIAVPVDKSYQPISPNRRIIKYNWQTGVNRWATSWECWLRMWECD